jgi:hypothetical protein
MAFEAVAKLTREPRMARQNNVHIPDDLLSAMNAAAEAEGTTADNS